MLKITNGTVVSDGHVVMLPAGLTGEVTLTDGTTVDLGPVSTTIIEVDSHDHAKEVAMQVSDIAHASGLPIEHDKKQSVKNLKAGA